MSMLSQQHCQPCEKGTLPLDQDRIQAYLAQTPGWSVEEGTLTRDVKVKNFREALALVNRIGELAEDEGHHPDLCIHDWNHVRIDLLTHSIGGLSENDFILAAKISELR
jgi:4a-hydroxytetrahydrobiopterin dehydratase